MENRTASGYRFRVSDVVQVPLRGVLLRLKLQDGTPKLGLLEPGSTIRLQAPDGEVRTAEVKAFSITGGRATQARLERYRELDVVVPPSEAFAEDRRVGIGWHVVGG